ncbi:MAG TPA: protein kinase [Candidatus Saccharimonadales bacterium]|nr:protein kinase [Candidatus Saccharimonadales bacterium]
MTLTTGTRLGPYEILGPLGAGGMGEVYRARDTRLGREVAIKVLPEHLSASPEIRTRFEREAKTISSLNHPNICTLFDVGHEAGTDFLVMELVEGKTLAERLATGPLPAPQALRLAAEIAEALARAHRSGIVHRDLKPGNVMITSTGAKLMDFGLARTTGTAGAPVMDGSGSATRTQTPTKAAPLTAEGAIVGTFQYMAPEQLDGNEADARSDIWALGCVIYEMLTGTRPFLGKSQASLISSIMKDEPRPVREIVPLAPRALDWIVRQCLAKDPEARRQSAADLGRDLRWLAEEGGDARKENSLPETHGKPGPARTRRFGFAISLAVVATALVAAAAGFVAGRRQAPASGEGEISFRSLTYTSQYVINARFMPDGKTVVFSSVAHQDHVQLFALRPESPEPQPIGAPDTHLLDVSSRGELAVLTDATYVHHRQFTGTLARMPLEGASPREVLEGVREAAWAPDGENLAIIRLVEGEDRLEYPIGNVLYRTGGYLSDLRVSPDGEKVAFLEHQSKWDDRGMVSVVDRSGHSRRLTGLFWGEEGLAWSPDGREILFSSGSNAAFTIQAVDLQGHRRSALASAGGLIILDVAPGGKWLATREDGANLIRGVGPGAEAERTLSVLSSCWGPVLSEDGRLLLFTDGNEGAGANYAVTLRRMDGSPATRLGEGDATDLSRDGKWALAVIRSRPSRLIAYPTGAGQPVTIETGSIVEFQNPRWFPDGRRVLVSGHEAGRPGRCWVSSLDGGAMKPLTPEGVDDGFVSPDGEVVAAWGPTVAPALYPLSGDGPRDIAGLTEDDQVIGWSEDGRSVFVRHGRLPALVDRVEISSSRRERIHEIGGNEGSGFARVSLISLAADPRYYAYNITTPRSTLFLIEGAR